MRAFLKNNRQAPRKIRLIARITIGKTVATAIHEYSLMPHKGARTIKKLIESAAANARQKDVSVKDEELLVKNITVDKGSTFVRFMPRAFGRATPLRKENSHIRVELERVSDGEVAVEKPDVKKVEKKEEKKVKVTKGSSPETSKKETKKEDK